MDAKECVFNYFTLIHYTFKTLTIHCSLIKLFCQLAFSDYLVLQEMLPNIIFFHLLLRELHIFAFLGAPVFVSFHHLDSPFIKSSSEPRKKYQFSHFWKLSLIHP